MILTPVRAALLCAPFLLAACGTGETKTAEGSAQTPVEKPADSTASGTETPSMGEMVLGDPNAPVTVIEYASVTCPHCATFHAEIFPAIKEKYVDTGKVKFVFREFPTAPAEFSYIGSVLARCAADKGGSDAYFAVLGTLFRTQRTWIYGDDPKAELLKIAGQAGMDEAAFDACLKRQELIDVINANVEEGSDKHKVTGTPSFVVNGEKMDLRSAEDFEKKLDELVAKAGN